MITLGLNYSQMHDSSACLVRDGELLFAVAEERISRVKHDARFPGACDSSLPRFREDSAPTRSTRCASAGKLLAPRFATI